MKKYLSAILISAILLTGCATLQSPPINVAAPPAPQKKVDQKSANTQKIIDALNTNGKIEEISKPNLNLPENINENQILKYFSLGNLKLALVLRPSMNVALTAIPKNFSPLYAGILIADENESSWAQFLEIRDNNANKSSKNNPYYLWNKDNSLMLSIVDQNGAGSGEGNMKIYSLSTDKNWEIANCYYFTGNFQVPGGGDLDYFSFSKELIHQKTQPFEVCRNDVTLIIKS